MQSIMDDITSNLEIGQSVCQYDFSLQSYVKWQNKELDTVVNLEINIPDVRLLLLDRVTYLQRKYYFVQFRQPLVTELTDPPYYSFSDHIKSLGSHQSAQFLLLFRANLGQTALT